MVRRPLVVLGCSAFTSLVLAATMGTSALSIQSAATDREQVAALTKQASDLIGAAGTNAPKVLALLEPILGQPIARDPAAVSEVHYVIGVAYYRLAKYPTALEHFQAALEGERAAGDRNAQTRTLRYVGQLHKNRGDYADGLTVCEQALAIDRDIGNLRGQALDAVVRGAILDLMGDHRRALASYEDALPILQGEVSHDAANLFNEVAITEKNLGNYAEALRYYNLALERDGAVGDTRGQMFVLLNLGVLHGTLGENDRAIEFTQRALEAARRIGDSRAQRILLLNLGSMFWTAGHEAKAIDALERVVAASRAEGGRSEENEALKDLGDIESGRGELVRARQYYDDALRLQREIGERRSEASTLIGLADLSLRQRNAAEARRFAEDALRLARMTGRPELEWNALRAAGDAAMAGGDTEGAIDNLRASARIVNDLRANVVSDAGKIAFVDQREIVFEHLAEALLRAGRAGEALEAAEAGRARAFADLLAQRQVLGKPAAHVALEAVRAAQHDWQTVAGEQAAGNDAPAARSKKTRSAETLDASVAALRTEHEELASLLTAESVSAADVIATAKRLDATLVEYLACDRQLLVWVVTPRGDVRGERIDVGRARLESLIAQARSALDASVRRPSPDVPLRQLHRILIGRIAAWLPRTADAPVVFIPDASLSLVPFAALEDAGGHPLAAVHTIAFAPAASIYRYTRDKVQRLSGRERRALVVADPAPPRDSGVAALPWARDEGQRVADRLKGMPVRLLVGADASEVAVKRDAGTFSLLHFATHGLVSSKRPLASSILLAAAGVDDGYLQVDEIFGLDLTAELVVLSGCSTGLGKSSGDGIIGLTRAFLYAGTPAVIVSQWDVNDRATAFLMDRFYAGLVAGRSKAAALRTAQLETARRYPNPALWAAFMLVGEPR